MRFFVALLCLLAVGANASFAQQLNSRPANPVLNQPVVGKSLPKLRLGVAPATPAPMASFPTISDTLVSPQLDNATCATQFVDFGLRFGDDALLNGNPGSGFDIGPPIGIVFVAENGLVLNVPDNPGYQARCTGFLANMRYAENKIIGVPDTFRFGVNRVNAAFTGQDVINFAAPPANTPTFATFTLNDRISTGDTFFNVAVNFPPTSYVPVQINSDTYFGIGVPNDDVVGKDSLVFGFLINSTADSLPNGQPCAGLNWYNRFRASTTNGLLGPNGQAGAFGNPQTLGASDEFTVNSPIILPIIEYYGLTASAGNDATINCGASTQLNGGTNYLAGFGTPITYSWSPATGLSNPNLRNPTASPSQTTTYTVTVSYGPQSTTDEVTITVNGPEATLSQPSYTSACGTSVTLGATSPDPQVTFSWQPAALLSDATTANPTYTNPTTSQVFTLTATKGNCSTTFSVPVTIDAPFTVDAGNSLAVPCGTSANLNAVVSGGTNLTYAWLPSTGLSASNIANPVATPAGNITYTVIVTNAAGCNASDEVSLVVNTNFSVSLPANQSAVCGAAVTLNATPNNPPANATYTWSNGSTGQSIVVNPTINQTYTVVLSNGSCEVSATTSVTVENLTVNGGASQTIGCGQSANLNATTNGGPGVTYQWAPTNGITGSTNQASVTAKPAQTTAYTVTATSGTCVATAVVPVVVNNNFNVSIAANGTTANVPCGTQIGLTASASGLPAGSNPTFTWEPASLFSAGNTGAQVEARPGSTVTVTVTASTTDCSATSTIQVSVDNTKTTFDNANFTGVKDETKPTECVYNYRVTAAAASNFDFEWTFENGTPDISTEPTPSVSYPVDGGTYQVTLRLTLKSQNACQRNLERPFVIEPCVVSREDAILASAINVYPNPTNGMFYVRYTGAGELSAKLFDIAGRQVATQSLIFNGAQEAGINLTNLPTGVYQLQIMGNGGVYNTKVIRN